MRLLISLFFFFFIASYGFAKVASTARDDVINTVPPKPIPQSEKQKILIAVVLPLSGNSAGSGQRLKNAIPLLERLLEEKRYNKEFSRKFEFETIVYDDGCDVEKAKQVAKSIVKRKDIHFVIGHYCSNATAAGAEIYKNNGIIQIAPFSTLSNLTERGYNHFFRLAGRNDRQAEEAGTRMNSFAQGRKIGIIYGYEDYGRDLAVRVRNVLRRTNTPLSEEIDLKRIGQSLEEVAAYIVRKDLKVVYYGGYFQDLVKLLKAVNKLGARILFFAGDSIQNREFYDSAGKLANNVLFTLTRDYSRDIPEQQKNDLARLLRTDSTQRKRGTIEATRALGGTYAVKDRAFVIRSRFIRVHFTETKEKAFPDLYSLQLFAAFQIIQNIAIDANQNAGLWNVVDKDEDGEETEFKRYRDVYEWADRIAVFMRDQGLDAYSDYVGFETVVGAVNFNESGDWSNAEYHIYRWIHQRENRAWVATKLEDEVKYKGRFGDFIRIF